jgi:hypothetical protein
MADEPETPPEGGTPDPPEQTVPYSRFEQVNKRAKEADASRKALEKTVAELQRAMEERESAGLPELDRLKKDMEKAQQRAEQAEARAEAADKAVARSARERMVQAAALAQNFADPSDASAFVNLDDIEEEKDAERAVKDLAKRKKHLLKAPEPTMPGRVLANGQPVTTDSNGRKNPAVAEAEMLSDALKQFVGRNK